ncbi:MAG: tetratricopeptide repeat protein, partial [Oligoflexia bacterium]|nr:tetratricopeptide repeat protein [Oligoflexia bacterium]
AIFNLAESYFWLDDYQESLNSYREFLEFFPNHPYSSFAMNRIGENLNLLGAPFNQVKSAYLETSFRYPESFGSTLSKIRLATNNVIIAKSKDLRQFIKILDDGILNKEYRDLDVFSVILKGEAVVKRGIRTSDTETVVKGITVWKDYLRKHPLTLYYPKLKEKIKYGISELMEIQSSVENYYDVVKTYESNIGMSILEDDPVELALIAAEAYFALSLDTQAIDKISLYENKKGDKNKRLYFLVKAMADISRKNINDAFSCIQQLERKGLEPDKDYQSFGRFKDRHKYTVYMVKSKLFQIKNETLKQADMLEKAVKSYIGKDSALIARHELELGLLYQKLNKWDDAVRVYTEVYEIEKQKGEAELKKSAMAEEALYYLGHIRYSRGQLAETVDSYRKAISLFPAGKESGLARYRVGKSLLKLGKIDEARVVFNDIVSAEESSTWKKMAQDELDNLKWDVNKNKP